MSIITIVIPYFGKNTVGGAENQARQLAQAMQQQGAQVEVWATTARNLFHAPEPYYSEGRDHVDGIPVRRFALTPPRRDPYIPDAVARRPEVRTAVPSFNEHEGRLLASLISSDALLEAVASEGDGRRFMFMPYPFPTSFWGVALTGELAHLLPCLHDEPYARYSTYRWMFRQVRGVLANTHAERELAQRLYDLPPEQVIVAGEGIDLSPRGDGARFRQKFDIDGPLLLYVGPRNAYKNTPLLLSYTREYWARRGATFTLALAGREELDLPDAMRTVVRDLGFLSSADKHNAYAAADMFIHPGLHESFSITLMEAWLQGAPALVHGDCAVTSEAARCSGGGAAFRTFGEFAAALDLLLGNAALRHELGARGRAYVLETCRWEDVARRTIDVVLSD